MGKAADNEGRKLRGIFFNNIAVGLVVTGIAVPYFASFAYALETNQFVIAVLEGKIRSGNIEFARGVNVVSALILAFGLAFLFRTIANAVIRDIKD
jgi:hypothetical protein